MTHVVFSIAATLFFVVVAATDAHADSQVRFAPITNSADFDEAMEFLPRRFAPPRDVEREMLRAGKWAPRKLDRWFEPFVRDWILLGKADLNGDGQEERFYIMGDQCDPAACEMLIVQLRPGERRIVCEVRANKDHVWITDRVTVHGYHEIEAARTIYWHGDVCVEDRPHGRDHLPPRDPLRK